MTEDQAVFIDGDNEGSTEPTPLADDSESFDGISHTSQNEDDPVEEEPELEPEPEEPAVELTEDDEGWEEQEQQRFEELVDPESGDYWNLACEVASEGLENDLDWRPGDRDPANYREGQMSQFKADQQLARQRAATVSAMREALGVEDPNVEGRIFKFLPEADQALLAQRRQLEQHMNVLRLEAQDLREKASATGGIIAEKFLKQAKRLERFALMDEEKLQNLPELSSPQEHAAQEGAEWQMAAERWAGLSSERKSQLWPDLVEALTLADQMSDAEFSLATDGQNLFKIHHNGISCRDLTRELIQEGRFQGEAPWRRKLEAVKAGWRPADSPKRDSSVFVTITKLTGKPTEPDELGSLPFDEYAEQRRGELEAKRPKRPAPKLTSFGAQYNRLMMRTPSRMTKPVID